MLKALLRLFKPASSKRSEGKLCSTSLETVKKVNSNTLASDIWKNEKDADSQAVRVDKTEEKKQANDLEKAGKPNNCVEKSKESKRSLERGISKADLEEQKRLAEIDQIASLFGPEIIYEAKFGKNKCTAQELALSLAKNSVNGANQFLADMIADYEANDAASVNVIINEPDYSRELTAEEKMIQGQFYAKQVQKTSREKNNGGNKYF